MTAPATRDEAAACLAALEAALAEATARPRPRDPAALDDACAR